MAKMEDAHSTALNDLVREICDHGSARIPERVLLGYHLGAKNVSKSIWRDLQQRFADETERRTGEDWTGYRLACLRQHAFVTFVAQEPEGLSESDRWWKSVSALAA